MDRRSFLGRALLVLIAPRVPRGKAGVDSIAPIGASPPSSPLPRAAFPIGGEIVSSGGLCAPITPYYALPVLSEPGRPIRDSLPTFEISRGSLGYDAPRALGGEPDHWPEWVIDDETLQRWLLGDL